MDRKKTPDPFAQDYDPLPPIDIAADEQWQRWLEGEALDLRLEEERMEEERRNRHG